MEKIKTDNSQESPNVVITKSARAGLAYTPEFKSYISNHPGYIDTSKKIFDILDSEKDMDEIDARGLKIERKHLIGNRSFYKAESKSDGEQFFVKVTKGEEDENPFDEVRLSQLAKRSLKDLPWAKVVDYQLGYVDKTKGYYVAKWNEIVSKTTNSSSFEWKDKYDEKKRSQLMDDMSKKIEVVTKKLTDEGFADVREYNMSYDESSGDLYVFDLRLREGLQVDDLEATVSTDAKDGQKEKDEIRLSEIRQSLGI